MDCLQALEAPRWKRHLSVWGLLCMCMSASARVCYLRISPLIVCEGTRSEAEALAAGTPRIQATPSSTTLFGTEFRGLAGRRERRGGRRCKEEWEGWMQPKEGEENIKEKTNREEMRGWRRHCPRLSQQTKAAFNTLRISNYWERSAPLTPCDCVCVCVLLNVVGNR